MVENGGDDAYDLPTKRHSGTLQRGPVFESLSRDLATEMEARARAGDSVARELAADALALAGTFASWALGDPGPAARREAIERWHHLDVRASALRGTPS